MVRVSSLRTNSLELLPSPSLSNTTSRSSNLGEDVVYEIVSSVVLPVIDISRSIRSVFLSPSIIKRFDRAVSKSRTLLFAIAHVAIAMAAATQLAPAWIGRYLAIPALLLSIVPSWIQILLMRYEIVVLLLQTYDFWFFSLVWLVSMVLFSNCLSDARALVNVAVWSNIQVNIMVDATTSFRDSVWLTVVGFFFSMVMIIAIGVGVVDELGDFSLFAVNDYVVSAQTIVLNGWSTCLLVQVRNVYRRRAAIRDHGANKTVVQCLAYRCRVRLQARSRRRRSANSLSSVTSVSSVSSLQMTRPTASYFANAKMIQMRCMRVKIRFSPRQLVAPFARGLLDHGDSDKSVIALRTALTLLMEVGAILTSVSCIPGVPRGGHYASLATTGLFCSISLCLCHRELLKFLVFSFDFAFLSFQLTTMHVALADLCGWDARTFTIASIWLWFHWLLTFDCIPPLVKKKVRLRNRLVVLIAIQFVLAHIFLVSQLMSPDRSLFRDRAVVNMELRGLYLEIRVLSVLVSRLPMTFGWSCRIVLRLLQRNENELIIIQGTVTYVNNRRKIKMEEAKFMSRTKSKVVELTRRVTRQMLAVANVVTPTAAALSASTPEQPTVASLEASLTLVRNRRLVNIACQVYDASRVMTSIQPAQEDQIQRQASVVGVGPKVFEIVSPRLDSPRLDSTSVSDRANSKFSPLDASLQIASMDSSVRSEPPRLPLNDDDSQEQDVETYRRFAS